MTEQRAENMKLLDNVQKRVDKNKESLSTGRISSNQYNFNNAVIHLQGMVENMVNMNINNPYYSKNMQKMTIALDEISSEFKEY